MNSFKERFAIPLILTKYDYEPISDLLCKIEIIRNGFKSDIFNILLSEESFKEKLEIFCLTDILIFWLKHDSVLPLAAVLFKIIANIFHLIHTWGTDLTIFESLLTSRHILYKSDMKEMPVVTLI